MSQAQKSKNRKKKSSLRICEAPGCGKPCSMQCSNCHAAAFCDRKCQKAAWKTHKLVCKEGESSKKKKTAMAKAAVAEAQGLNNMRRNLHEERMEIFWKAVNGQFTVQKDSNIYGTPASSITDRTRLRIIDDNGIELADFNFLNPASIACEMYAHTFQGSKNYHPNEYRVLEGGLLYLIGQEDLFWSMIMHYNESGATIPPINQGSSENLQMTWAKNTFLGNEMDVMDAKIENMTKIFIKGSRVKSFSESLAFCNLFARMRCPGALSSSSGGMHPALDLIEDSTALLPTMYQELPLWWVQTQQHWDGAIQRAVSNRKLQCMFYCTPNGCRDPDCVAWHENAYQKQVQEIQREYKRFYLGH